MASKKSPSERVEWVKGWMERNGRFFPEHRDMTHADMRYMIYCAIMDWELDEMAAELKALQSKCK